MPENVISGMETVSVCLMADSGAMQETASKSSPICKCLIFIVYYIADYMQINKTQH